MIPREVWILLGITLALVAVAYVAVKLLVADAESKTARTRRPPDPQPTLAELVAKSVAPRAKAPVVTQSAGDRSRTIEIDAPPASAGPEVQPGAPAISTEALPTPVERAAPDREVGDPRLQHADAQWRRVRDLGIQETRARSEALREQFARAATPPPTAAATPLPPPLPSQPIPEIPDEAFFTAEASNAAPAAVHAIAAPPDGYGDGRWVAAGESVTISDVAIPRGLLYVGARLNAINGLVDPCLISAHLPIATVGSYRNGGMSFWPSFATISPTQRRAYLNWLAQGRSDPACDIGFVFLYFYGLERRIILDTSRDDTSKAEWPVIASEVRRLLSIYGGASDSFRRYATDLLNWVDLQGLDTRLYDESLPAFAPSYEVPFRLRLTLGQAALDRSPLSASLALAWLRHAPGLSLRTPATRCPDEFASLWTERYRETFGKGLILPKNKTKLKAQYRPASPGFAGQAVDLTFGEIPDVAALTAPVKKLQELAERCTGELAAYSRLLGKEPTLKGSLEAALLLPPTQWPRATRDRLEALAGRMGSEPLTLSVDELGRELGASPQALTRERLRAVATALDDIGLGLEPNILTGARAPAGRDPVVVFRKSAPEEHYTITAAYQTAVLTLQLAAACACADGQFHALEIAHLQREIDGWRHLAAFERERLRAHLQLLVAAPPTLAALRSKLEPLPTDAKETLATMMATLVQSDGVVVPEEVKFLEKAYRVLGVDTARVFSDVHAGASGTPAKARKTRTTGFQLDRDRIAALQRDTEQVSALLSKIFVEEPALPTQDPPAPEPEVQIASGATPWPLVLDEQHTALARLLLSRAQWSRAELEDAAADLDLMLDGALEQINEAAFDAFDVPLCEGDQTVDINSELLEKLAA
ncbi:tellurite resistance TerB family protein [Lysobacter xanthus]